MQRETTKIFLILLLALTFMAFSPSPVSAQTRVDVVNFISEDGLAPGTPVTVTVDPQGWAWIGSASIDEKNEGGLSVITKNRRIIAFTKEDGLADNQVHDILTDPDRNCIWFATSGGLTGLDSKTGKWESFNKTNSELKDNHINFLRLDENKDMWIGTHGGGLYRMAAGGRQIEAVKCPFDKVTGMTWDSKGRLWVSSWEGVAYRENNIWVNYNAKNSTFPNDRAHGVVQGPNGEILVATERGVAVFDGISWSVIDTSNSKLPVDNITSMMVDSKKNLWLGTWGGGVVKFDSKREKLTVYSRKNSDIIDNQVSDVAEDPSGNVYITTMRGISYIVDNPTEVIPEIVTDTNNQGFYWENKSSSDTPVTTMNALPVNRYGYVIWAYSAFFADKDFPLVDPRVTINWDISDNRWLNVLTKSPLREYLQVCVTKSKITRHYVADRTISYPFPQAFPPEIQVYLQPGEFFPSDDPAIKDKVKSFVRNSSKGDMLKTAEDIIFSRFFTVMPYDYSKSGNDEKGQTCNDPRKTIVRTPQEVMKDNLGIGYSKNRTVVTMLRAAGIPARLIFQNGCKIWGEAYIEGWGWVPFDVTMPIYTQGENADMRCLFPMVVEKGQTGTAWVSGRNDDSKVMFWDPTGDAFFKQGSQQAGVLKDINKLKTAKFIVVRPASEEEVPGESRIPVSTAFTMLVKKDGQFYTLRFYDQANKIVHKVPITEYYKTMEANVKDRVQLKFIPSYMGEYLILRILEWKVLD